jgi:carboxymethylenebutenolidase
MRTVNEEDVQVQTPDGVCDAAFFHPEAGSFPAVLIWPDAFGLRPVFRDMARRLAAEGYAVLVPNPFYRVRKAPVFPDAAGFDFHNPSERAKLQPLRESLNPERDAPALVAFLDSRKEVDKSKKVGTQGYCMGGPLAVRTAAVVPNRIGAAASFHGGGLVTDRSDSPHLLAPRIKARTYVAVASNDDEREPEAKQKFKEAFAAAGTPADVEVYPNTLHGWCISDMPLEDGKPIYSKPDAERAWAKLLDLYRSALA